LIRALGRDGLQELTFASGTSAKWSQADDFVRLVMAKL
jgi:hypothetical protein